MVLLLGSSAPDKLCAEELVESSMFHAERTGLVRSEKRLLALFCFLSLTEHSSFSSCLSGSMELIGLCGGGGWSQT